jgi:tetratricopeptide (TPR) repeat protein
MKLTMKLFVLVICMLLLAITAHADSPFMTFKTPIAASPREQLQQMVEQLQKNPADNALREKIIKLAQEIKPAPAVPEEAERRMARGTAAFKVAKSTADYGDAVREFEQSTLAAPWYGDAYHNLGVAQDKAGQHEAALRSLKLALLASPDSKEIKGIIYEVEYRIERANSPEVRAAQEKEKQDTFLRSLDGAKFVRREESSFIIDYIREIHGTTLILKKRLVWAGPANLKGWQSMGHKPNRIGEEIEEGRYQWDNGKFIGVERISVPWYKNDKFDRMTESVSHYVATVSPDGRLLTIIWDRSNTGTYEEYGRYQRQ